jgi:hypothetical protein
MVQGEGALLPGLNESKANGEYIALGNSREPPAAKSCGRVDRWY